MRSQTHWPSVLQFALSTLAVFTLWSGALILASLGLVAAIVEENPFADPVTLTLLSAGQFAGGLLLCPSAYYALRRLLGSPVKANPDLFRRLHIGWWIFLPPVVLLLGLLIAQRTELDWLLLPVLHVLAIGLPVVWLLWLAARDLPLGSPQRMWGVFGSGLVLAPVLIAIVEGLAAIAFVLLGIIVISSRPEMMERFMVLSEWLANANPSPEEVVKEIGPFLLRPAVIISMLAFWSLIVPLIEEVFKPVGVWLLIGRKWRPAAGFAAGALSGAGYAMFESLALSSRSAEWAALVGARMGTGVIHIFTTALTGWALVVAWERRKYVTLGLAYLAAVFIHGLWNGLTLFSAYTALADMQNLPLEMPRLVKLGNAAPFGLIALAVIGLFSLLWANRALARSLAGVKPIEPGFPPPSSSDP